MQPNKTCTNETRFPLLVCCFFLSIKSRTFVRFSLILNIWFTWIHLCFFVSVCSMSSAKWSKRCFSLSKSNKISFICVIRLMLQCVLNVIWALYFFSSLPLAHFSWARLSVRCVVVCECTKWKCSKKIQLHNNIQRLRTNVCLFHSDSTALEKPCIALALCEFEVRSYAKKT